MLLNYLQAMVRALHCLILPLALIGSASLAKSPDDAKDEEKICLPVAVRWRADAADLQRIQNIPVPESFRSQFESPSACWGPAISPPYLIDWHLNFGSEASTSHALGYLARSFAAWVPAPGRYGRDLEKAWQVAEADLRKAGTIGQSQGPGYTARHQFLQSSLPTRRFRTLIDAQETYRRLAKQYLRAAETFYSPTLLAKAELYLKPALDGVRILTQVSDEPGVALLSIDLDAYAVDDLQMRAAVMRARLTGSSKDMDEAQRIVSSFYSPEILDAGKSAYAGGDTFCEFPNDVEPATQVLCKNNDEAFPAQVTNYWFNRAMLDMVRQQSWDESFNLAVRLLDLDRSPEGDSRFGWRDDLISLHQMRADLASRNLDFHQALLSQKSAERLSAPDEAPAQFKRTAEKWLAIWAQARAMNAELLEEPELRRYAAYLQSTLRNIDSIATASAASP